MKADVKPQKSGSRATRSNLIERIASSIREWLMDIWHFTKFISERRPDTSFPVFRLGKRERRFVYRYLGITLFCFVILDQWYLAWAQAGHANPHGMFASITILGNSSWIFSITIPLIILMSIFSARRYSWRKTVAWHRVYHTLTLIFLAVLISGVLVILLKNGIGRVRPQYVGAGVLEFNPFSGSFRDQAFPSGHSTTAGALAVALGIVMPRFWKVFFTIGAIVALSRTMVEAHYPSDVVAGFSLGGAVAWYIALCFARIRILFRFDERGNPVPHSTWDLSLKDLFMALSSPDFSSTKSSVAEGLPHEDEQPDVIAAGSANKPDDKPDNRADKEQD